MKDQHELAMEQLAQQATWVEKTGGYAKDMTLRDWFAGLAMQGSRSRNSQYDSWNSLAEDAYEIADAILKERNK